MTNNLPSSLPLTRVLMPQLLWPRLPELIASLKQQWQIGPYGPECVGDLPDLPHQSSLLCALPDYAAIAFSGADVLSFLQGQLTNDVAALGIGQTQLTGYCTPKGRLLASGWLSRTAQSEYQWLVSSPLALALSKRLRMFVMRSKVQVACLSDSHCVFGVVHGQAIPNLNELGADCVTVQLQATHFGREASLLLVPVEQAVATWDNLLAHAKIVPTHYWRSLEIQSGIARITANTSELFVPQMVNFELTGGVSFKKGCYPGQEIVARSQYLGKLKRRMLLAQFKGGELPLPGSDVWAGTPETSEPIGQIVMSATSFGQSWALVETGELALDAEIYTQAASGVALPLQRMALPYPIEKIA